MNVGKSRARNLRGVKHIEAPGISLEILCHSEIDLPNCQRGQEKKHIREMANSFDERGFGVPIVGKRMWHLRDGEKQYCLIDGQQRCEAAIAHYREDGYYDISFYALTIELQSPEEESLLFWIYNNHKTVPLADRLWAQIDCGRGSAPRLLEIFEEVGRQLPLRSCDRKAGKKLDPDCSVRGINWCDRQVVVRDGDERLRRVLRFVNLAFPRQPYATCQGALEGVNYFLTNLDTSRSPSAEVIAQAINGKFREVKLGAALIQKESKDPKMTAVRAFAESIVATYNQRRRTRKAYLKETAAVG